MRKADIVNIISDKTGIAKVDVLLTLESFFKETMHKVAEGETLYIRGFGSFGHKIRKAKIGRNIKKNQAVHIPERKMPIFKPSDNFIDLLG